MIEFVAPQAPERKVFFCPLKNLFFEGDPSPFGEILRSKGFAFRTEKKRLVRYGAHKGGENLVFRSPYPGEIFQKGRVFAAGRGDHEKFRPSEGKEPCVFGKKDVISEGKGAEQTSRKKEGEFFLRTFVPFMKSAVAEENSAAVIQDGQGISFAAAEEIAPLRKGNCPSLVLRE